ncbi:MAG: MopE-related protein [Myxococcales bacterium]|nr:MopE-related protein [Polyangiaceae bacterium]MDW8248568.1 MopE-related protein [Myxococcales bacterium]
MSRQLLLQDKGRWLATMFAVASLASLTISCASGDDTTLEATPVAGGKGGTAGSNAGGTGGTGVGGAGGSAGSAGSAGKSTGGSAGIGGEGGSSGQGGAAGDSGSAGTAGDGGTAGTSGAGGSAGDAGAGGDAGGSNCQPEICDGLDNDCDGQKDEDIPGTGEPCTVPNKQGECAFGTVQCTKGKIECVQNVGATPEVCDGKDNNCDGQIDNAPTDIGNQCFTDQQGLCAQGTLKCVSGDVKCVSNFQPTEETCNGFDDNCDGNVDEGFPGAGQPCSVPGQLGPCGQGQTTCQNAGNSCAQVVFPQSEVCDGVDNDCDGQIDEAADVVGKPCNTGLLGECKAGLTQCAGGAPSCQPIKQASPEVCDGLDNDCDGTVDNIPASKLATDCAKDFPNSNNVQTWACEQGSCVIQACAGSFVNCDGSLANGCEVDSTSNINHCGGCNKVCPAINGTPTCIASQCGIVCNLGFGNCDGVIGNGCEQPLTNDPANCGTCNKQCSDNGGSGVCNGGSCKTECNAGRADCDKNANNGCETFTTNDPLNCGACGKTCSSINATATCENGICTPICNPGFANCDGDPNNGCEVNLNTNVNHCGACNNVCNSTNGAASCSNGVCGLSCNPGYGDCDLNAANGCEINTSTNVNHCGVCGKACNNTNGTPSCSLGVCSISCSSGFANCNGNADDGCEIDLKNDVNNCGSCGNKCNSTNGTAVCDNGVCKISACNPGFANCDNNPNNGCEINTNTNVNHCGACNNQCNSSGGGASCNGGQCGITCNPGLADCDGNAANGCEVNLATNTSHCGSCGNSCNPVNASSASCSSGACNFSCNAGFANCNGLGSDGCETNTTNNTNHCGGCGIVCIPTNADSASCSNSKCVFQCKPGFADCDNNPANGCETNISSSNSNCGACGNACVIANGVGACQSGQCVVTGCSAPFQNCDGNSANGCETNTAISTSHCGGCGNACSTNNSTPVCTSGQCMVGSCNPGFGNCDNNPNNGCETNLNTNLNHCGQCGNVCTNTANAISMTCSSGSCQVATCAASWFNVDGNGSNGCECQEDNVGNNCGEATDLGVVNLGQTISQNRNLTGAGNSDEDWFKVTFPKVAACNYSPTVIISAGSLPIRAQIYSSCAGTSASVPRTCGPNEAPDSSVNLTRWDWDFNKPCQTNSGSGPNVANPAKPIDNFIQGSATYFIRVLRSGVDSSNSCMNYTITISNTLG